MVPKPGICCKWQVPGLRKLQLNDLTLYILRRLHYVLRLSQVAPIIFIGPKGDNLFSATGEPQIRIDDGKSSVFTQHAQQSWRNHMNARKRECLNVGAGVREV